MGADIRKSGELVHCVALGLDISEFEFQLFNLFNVLFLGN